MSKRDFCKGTVILNKTEFDKYDYYKRSVQTPDVEAEFLTKTFKELRGNAPAKCREDFCGTFAVSCEIAKLDSSVEAYGVDIDEEPIKYGEEKNLSLLNEEEKRRVHVSQGSVLDAGALPESNLAFALNFSYFSFKERRVLKSYYENVYQSLSSDGVFVMDCFGGSQCYEANEEETEHEEDGFSYFWDQESYNPITNEAQFYIHFQRDGEGKREKVFSYDWRMWSIPELRDLLLEAGFKDVKVYWEGTDDDGEGDGVYTETKQGEECESWVAYIVALK